jgi:hypothetical protein
MSATTASMAAMLVGGGLEAEASAKASRSCCLKSKRWPGRAARWAYSASSSAAVSRTCSRPSSWLSPTGRSRGVCRSHRLRVGAGVAGDDVQLRHRHVELVAAVVLQVQELGVALAEVHVQEAEVAADAVLDVHHRVADLELGQVAQPAFHGGGLAAVAAHAAARGGGVELGLGEHREPCSSAARSRARAGRRPARGGRRARKAPKSAWPRGEVVLGEELGHGLAPAGRSESSSTRPSKPSRKALSLCSGSVALRSTATSGGARASASVLAAAGSAPALAPLRPRSPGAAGSSAR